MNRDDEVKIVKVKVADETDGSEEACVQMELLGHAFYVFLNSKQTRWMWFTRGKGNTYGLIERNFRIGPLNRYYKHSIGEEPIDGSPHLNTAKQPLLCEIHGAAGVRTAVAARLAC